ncbi:MAG: ABC transporter permease [Planctomycetota bacterium]
MNAESPATAAVPPLAGRIGLTAKVGLWLLALLLFLAIFAPLIASSRPYFLWVPEQAGGTGFGALPSGWSFPLFTSLFDRHQYQSGVDLFFNGLLVLLPVFLGLLLVRKIRKVWRWLLPAWAVLSALLAASLLHGEPDRDYSSRIERLIVQGHAPLALFPPVPHSFDETDVLSTVEAPSSEHLVGTDPAGRDVFARLLFGSRMSLTIGLVAVSIYVLIGVVLGALAGYFRGWVDALILRAIEVVSCFPSFLLVMTLIALVRERSIFHIMVVIGLCEWPTVARLVRAEFLRQSELDYSLAARALGLSRRRIIFRHILPNTLAPVMVTAAFGVAGAILLESGLSFLNLGDASVSSWGQVLRAGRDTGELHLILAPGLLILVSVTMMNLVAEGLRDALDPKLRRT